MTRNNNLTWLDFVDRLTDPPSDGPIQRLGIGLAVSALSFVYGLSWLLFPPESVSLPLSPRYGTGQQFATSTSGHVPVAVGLAFVLLGLYLHFHWYWGNHPRLNAYYVLLQGIALLGLAASIIYGFAAFALTS